MHIGILSQPSNFHCQKWANALKKSGNQVTIFSLENFQVENIPCINLNPNKKSWAYQDFYFTRKRLKEAIKSEKIDVLHPLHLTPYGVWGLWSEFKPVIPAAMGADVFEYLPLSAIPELKTRFWKSSEPKYQIFNALKTKCLKSFHRAIVKKVLKNANFVTADNQALLHALKLYFYVPEEKLVLLRWGIDEEIFHVIPPKEYDNVLKKYGLNSEKPIVLSPRGLMPIYHGDIILDAFQSLVQIHENFQWVILSAGYPIPQFLNKKIQELEKKYQNFHCIKNQIHRHEMAVLWKHTKIFVSAPIYDGYSASVGEGRYVGAIPIVNNIPANLEIIRNQENGVIVQPFNAQNLIIAINYVINNFNEIYEKFKSINQQWILKNGLIKQDAERFTNLIKSLL